VAENLGAAASDAFFSESLTLNSVPGTILEYVTDLYDNPAAEDMYDFIVEDAALAGTVVDSGNLFDFASFDPCYDSSSESATAGTHGGAIGAVSFCSGLSTSVESLQEFTDIAIYPNPTGGYFSIAFELEQSSKVGIQILDMTGSLVTTVTDRTLQVGQHSYNVDLATFATQGIYLVSIQTNTGVAVQKIVLQ